MKRFIPSRSRSMMVAVVIGTAFVGGAQAVPAPSQTPAIEGISRYCQTCWRNARLPADRWQDCTQDVFIRLIERVEPSKWSGVLVDDETAERREFLRAIDAVKKRTQRARKFSSLNSDFPEHLNTSENSIRDEREAVAKAAREVLSPRQRRILELTADGWGVPEIAGTLSTTVERISDEKYKAIKKLQHYFNS